MKLEKLLYGVEIQKTNVDLNTEIKEIKIDSRKVEKGDLFVCLEGVNDDGNNHIGEIDCAFVALTEKEPKNAKFVLVKDARKAYAQVCENRFLRPLEGMKFVAVVGTNRQDFHRALYRFDFVFCRCKNRAYRHGRALYSRRKSRAKSDDARSPSN